MIYIWPCHAILPQAAILKFYLDKKGIWGVIKTTWISSDSFPKFTRNLMRMLKFVGIVVELPAKVTADATWLQQPTVLLQLSLLGSYTSSPKSTQKQEILIKIWKVNPNTKMSHSSPHLPIFRPHLDPGYRDKRYSVSVSDATTTNDNCQPLWKTSSQGGSRRVVVVEEVWEHFTNFGECRHVLDGCTENQNATN